MAAGRRTTSHTLLGERTLAARYWAHIPRPALDDHGKVFAHAVLDAKLASAWPNVTAAQPDPLEIFPDWSNPKVRRRWPDFDPTQGPSLELFHTLSEASAHTARTERQRDEAACANDAL